MYCFRYEYGLVKDIRNGMVSQSLHCAWDMELGGYDKSAYFAPKGRFTHVCPLLVKDACSFNDFMGKILPKMMQAYEYIRYKEMLILMYKPCDEGVLQLMSMLKLPTHRLIFYKSGLYTASHQVNTCICPPFHPKLWTRARNLLNITNSTKFSTVSKGKVVFISQSETQGLKRKFANKDRVMEYLTEKFGKKNVIEYSSMQGLNKTIEIFKNASIVISIHGLELLNILFSPKRLDIIEVLTIDRMGFPVPPDMDHTLNWMSSQTMGHNYWRISVKPIGIGNAEMPMGRLSQVLGKLKH